MFRGTPPIKTDSEKRVHLARLPCPLIRFLLSLSPELFFFLLLLLFHFVFADTAFICLRSVLLNKHIANAGSIFQSASHLLVKR